MALGLLIRVRYCIGCCLMHVLYTLRIRAVCTIISVGLTDDWLPLALVLRYRDRYKVVNTERVIVSLVTWRLHRRWTLSRNISIQLTSLQTHYTEIGVELDLYPVMLSFRWKGQLYLPSRCRYPDVSVVVCHSVEILQRKDTLTPLRTVSFSVVWGNSRAYV